MQAVQHDAAVNQADFAKENFMAFGKLPEDAPLAVMHPALKSTPKPYQLQVRSPTTPSKPPGLVCCAVLCTSHTPLTSHLLQGVQWMISRETGEPAGRGFLHLHPCWLQLVTMEGLIFYVNRWAPHAVSLRFFPAQSESRCGGFLCDEVGC